MSGPNPPGPYGPPPPDRQPPPPPYGQQPYGQSPPPPPPPAYGQPAPPNSGYPPAPMGEPVRRGAKKLWLIIGILVAVLVAGGAGVYFFGRSDVSTAGVGDCVKINKASSTDADVDKVDCTDADAALKVAVKLDTSSGACPTEDYPLIKKAGGSGPEFTLCLIPNAKDGDCFSGLEAADTFARVDCANADFKFVRVINGTADEASCDAESLPLVYPDPPTTFCLTQP